MNSVFSARVYFFLALFALPLFFFIGHFPNSAPTNAPDVSPNVVVSQVYGGGGNSGAPYKNDFIELFNRGSLTLTLTGWSVQYGSANLTAMWQTTVLTGTLGPGQYFLIQEASGGTNGVNLPTFDVSGTINLNASAGKVALVNNSTALVGACPSAGVVDLIGYGNANCFEVAHAVTLTNSTAAIRAGNGCTDTDNNANDFSASAPNPRNTASSFNPCNLPTPTPTATPTSIHSSVKIVAALYDGYHGNDDEAVELMNTDASSVNISGWNISNTIGAVSFPATSLMGGQRIWLANKATAFESTFGFAPNFEYGADTDPIVPQMNGTAPLFSDSGGEFVLRNNSNAIQDVLVYENGNTNQIGWNGAAVQPYTVFPMNDPTQIIFRKLNETTGYPMPDTDSANDWAQTKACAFTLYGPVRDCDVYGKKPMAPGWATGIISPTQAPTDNWVTLKVTETANVSILAAPDNIYDAYTAAISSATTSIYIEGYTMSSPSIVNALKAKAQAGVPIKILMEGEPCCTDLPDQETLWAMNEISTVASSAQIFFMSNLSTTNGITVTYHHDRYDNQHAKFTLIDAGTPQQLLLTGTENFNCDSMPPDNKANGTRGNRGYYVKTDAPAVVAKYLALFNQDLDARHDDIVTFGTPPYVWDLTTVPPNCGDGNFYAVQKPTPLDLSGTFPFEVVQCPDNCLHYDEALIGMIRRAGAGDWVFVEQAYERTYWGAGAQSPPFADPNPRLEAYIEAARRGAHVRILLDGYCDDATSARSNANTAPYVNSFARATMDIQARVVDASSTGGSCNGGAGPTGTGIHAKIALVYKPAQNSAWVHIGSINGSESSSKFNRELALQIESLDAFRYMYDLFNYDWRYACGKSGNPVCDIFFIPALFLNAP